MKKIKVIYQLKSQVPKILKWELKKQTQGCPLPPCKVSGERMENLDLHGGPRVGQVSEGASWSNTCFSMQKKQDQPLQWPLWLSVKQ